MSLKKIGREFRIFAESIKYSFLREPDSHCFILGKEKSGTTAIAKLLGEYSQMRTQLDIPAFWDVEDKIYSGEMEFNKFYRINRNIFKNKVIKEPGFTYVAEQLIDLFPNAKFVMIARDPRDNIKSIFSRLKIKGTVENFDQLELSNFHNSWKNVLTNEGLSIPKGSPIFNAAHRWNIAVEAYLKQPEKFLLVKYEDFNNNKLKIIKQLGSYLSFSQKKNINNLLNRQFQPSSNKDIDWLTFFGEDNLAIINEICREKMNALQYECS